MMSELISRFNGILLTILVNKLVVGCIMKVYWFLQI